MTTINDFDSLVRHFYSLIPRRRVAAVCPDDEPTLSVVRRCLDQGIAFIHLIAPEGRAEAARSLADEFPQSASLTTVGTPDDAAVTAVKLVHNHEADVVLKGNINTDNLLRAVLNKEYGLLPKGNVLSHVALVHIPGFDRMLIFSDAAVIPEPTLEQLDAIIGYDVKLLHRLGHEEAKVALIHFTEKFNDRFECTTFYRELLARNAAGHFGPTTLMGGPMDVKTACDGHAAAIKGIVSPVAGKANILIFPNLVAANTFYKTLSLFAHAEIAAMLTGTTAPIVVPSRADSDESKFLSLALACVAAG